MVAPILFYAARHTAPTPVIRTKPKPKPSPSSQYSVVLEGVRSLGLTMVTAADVEAAIKQLFPGGTDGIDVGEVIRSVFLSIEPGPFR